jgi:FtsZ-interacting cell division protein ZipA
MNDYLIPVMVVAIIVVINIALWTSLSGKKAVKNSARWTQISQSIQKPSKKKICY